MSRTFAIPWRSTAMERTCVPIRRVPGSKGRQPRIAEEGVAVLMRLDDLRRLVADSTPGDWHKIGCYGAGADSSRRHGHRSVFVFRADVNLTMAYGAPVDDGEPWQDAELAPGPKHDVRVVLLDVLWAGALVDRQALLLVDDGRGILPDYEDEAIDTGQLDAEAVPRTASARAVRTARLVLCLTSGSSTFDEETRVGDRFDFYFRRSGIVEIPEGRASGEQDERTENSPAGHRLHRSADVDGLVDSAGCPPSRRPA